MNRRKSFYKRLAALGVALATLLPLTGCQQEAPAETVLGVRIEEDPAYSAETMEYAERTLSTLVTEVYRQAVLNTVSDKVAGRLADYAHRLCLITAATPVGEAQYLRAMDLLAKDGAAATAELIAFYRGESADCTKARRLYLDLSGIYGADRVASMLYDCALLIYDVRYERTMEKWETYQYPWYAEEAEAIAAERATFAACVGREDFSALVRCTTAMAELLLAGGAGEAEAFSDAELLEVIRRLSLSDIQIEAAGWRLLLSHMAGVGDSPLHEKMWEAGEKNGDADRLAEAMNSMLGVWISSMNRLTAEELSLLRGGDREAFVSSVFARFSEEDWTRFLRATALPLDNTQYSAWAVEEYGEDFSSFLSTLRPVSADALRACVGRSDFYSELVQYLSGICPTVSYEVMHDQSK